MTATNLAVGEQRRDRAVDPAAHRHERAPGSRRHGAVGARSGADRPRERVGGQVGRVQLARAQPTELGGEGRAAQAGGVEQRRPADELDGSAGGGDRRAAAGGLEAGVRDAIALHGHAEAHEIATRRAAGHAVMAAGGLMAAPARMAQVVGEALVGHAVECRPARS